LNYKDDPMSLDHTYINGHYKFSFVLEMDCGKSYIQVVPITSVQQQQQ